MVTLLPVLFILTLLVIIFGVVVAILYMFRERGKKEPGLHLICGTCQGWRMHTPRGAQLDAENNPQFYLYTCESCRTTRALK